MSVTLRAKGTEGTVWRMEVQNEVWEFKDKETMKAVLEQLITIKDTYGRIDKRDC